MPFQIETNARGQILMMPTALHQGNNANRISRQLGDGEVIVEYAVETADGVKEIDQSVMCPGFPKILPAKR
jgi:hypothetical protein